MPPSFGFFGADGNFATFAIDQLILNLEGVVVKRVDKDSSRRAIEEAAECDVVVFSVPPMVYESVMREVIPLTRPDTVLIDICTVKMHTVNLLHELADGRPYVACHPMFGPQGFAENGNSFHGLELVVCEQMLDTYEQVRAYLCNLGLVIRRMTPEQHDRAIAEEQLLPQHVGRIVAEAGFERSKMGAHTVSSRHFYTAMEIVKPDESLFEQVAMLNPFWPEIEARYELAAAKRRLKMVRAYNGRH